MLVKRQLAAIARTTAKTKAATWSGERCVLNGKMLERGFPEETIESRISNIP